MITGKVLNFQEHTVTVEFEDQNGLQRIFIPRNFVNSSVKGIPVPLGDEILRSSIPYSDVDLELSLGDKLSIIQVRELEQTFRRAGLWTREDYRKNYKLVNKVARDVGVDPVLILNAAAYIPKELD